MPQQRPQARYFPVRVPYRMQAGLFALGTDFGNGAADAQCFQVDDRREHYLSGKRAAPRSRCGVIERDARDRELHGEVMRWMRDQVRHEHAMVIAADTYAGIAAEVQEDFAVVRRRAGDGKMETVAVCVAFPSSWYPERIAGRGFREIHEPVPGFGDVTAANASMVRSMIERGPYTRFVWTVCADDHLDHHPDEGRRAPWRGACEGWLRVERQVTVPFADAGAALFLIRVYLYPFRSLGPAQRDTLATALETMDPAIVRYKGLEEAQSAAVALLRSEDIAAPLTEG